MTALKKGAGFTLIELTIAVTLLGVLAAILYGAFYVGQRAIEKAAARSEETQRARAAYGLLSGYIRSAYPYRHSEPQRGVYFSGDPAGLSLVSALSVGLGGRGMARVTLSWSGEDQGSGDLILEEEMPVRLSEEEPGGVRNSVILRRQIQGFHIDYLPPGATESALTWIDEWNGEDRNGLPRAVRLSYREKNGREVRWIFPIMMNVLAP